LLLLPSLQESCQLLLLLLSSKQGLLLLHCLPSSLGYCQHWHQRQNHYLALRLLAESQQQETAQPKTVGVAVLLLLHMSPAFVRVRVHSQIHHPYLGSCSCCPCLAAAVPQSTWPCRAAAVAVAAASAAAAGAACLVLLQHTLLHPCCRLGQTQGNPAAAACAASH
jgi:hypothetical protein